MVLVDRLQIEAIRPAVCLNDPLFDRDDGLELLPKGDGIDEVAHADAESTHLVLERGADAAKRRARAQVAFQVLFEAVDDLVVRHHDMGSVADEQVLDRMAKGASFLDLLQELRRIDHDAVADHVHRALPEDARRQQMECVQLFAHLDRVARVRAALEPHDDVRAVGEEVDNLPLAFVPKLGSYHNGRGHANRRRNIAPGLMVPWRPATAASGWRSSTPDNGSSWTAIDLPR